MEEIIIDLLVKYSPALVAILTTIASIITFFGKVKKLAKNNDNIVNSLKNALKGSNENICAITDKYSLINENLSEQLKTANDTIQELCVKNDLLQEEIKELSEERKSLATIKNQLKELLRKEGE